MDQEFLLKAVLIVSISLSILVFTFFVIRVLISLKKLIDETTVIVTDASEVTSTVADGVRSVKKNIGRGNLVAGIFSVLMNMGLLGQIKDWLKKRNNKESKVEEEAV